MFSEFCSISALSCSFEFVVGGWVVVVGVPSDYLVSTQLQLWLFCRWGCGCVWAVTICLNWWISYNFTTIWQYYTLICLETELFYKLIEAWSDLAVFHFKKCHLSWWKSVRFSDYDIINNIENFSELQHFNTFNWKLQCQTFISNFNFNFKIIN